ncbi:hypothetical protein [Desulfoscipio geothermicus]|uniref:Uncharacterized protein n=1 Tax=Desulfoscipio geothermicus DSM 3669 TaxID=1121426 RepID=A0A1I6DNR7_9FIRM|nr:hypothetical protein [Desulfoscipio geothermicus]SFR07090.1 hypothetical protein SAMN05660706_11437 [Desulfoscipio geothermicus DSM 3669]
MKQKASLFIFGLLTLIILSPAWASAQLDDQYGIYYRHARVFGKAMHYDPDRDLCIVYGSVFVREPGGGWRTLETKKFLSVQPANQPTREALAGAPAKTVVLEGTLNAWPGQKEEILLVTTVQFSEYNIDIPEWYAFGKTIKTEQAYKFSLNQVNDFVDILAGLARAINIPQNQRLNQDEITSITEQISNPGPNDRQLVNQVKNELKANWNNKWLVVKDGQAANDLRAGVGGWQLYRGLQGNGNCYVNEAPVIRKNLTEFMDAVTTGGRTPKKEGAAIMCAHINAIRETDKTGRKKIVKVTASGALYDTLQGFYKALKNPSGLNLETWKLKGWSDEDVKLMENKLCWLSGHRVLVYKTSKITGKRILVDQYFKLDNYLTQDGFNNILDVGNEIITEGGV